MILLNLLYNLADKDYYSHKGVASTDSQVIQSNDLTFAMPAAVSSAAIHQERITRILESILFI